MPGGLSRHLQQNAVSGVAYRFYGYAARAGGCCSGRHWRAAARGHRAEQRALASFIEKGHYARHLAAMRRLYRKRQQQLREALAQEITVPCDVLGGGGGMHLTVAMEGVNDRTLAQQARQFQLAPAALSHFYLDPQRARSGLVLGYGNTSASRYLPALRTLNRLIAQHRRA